jgi:nitrite reductase (cytochrome c-552)
MTKNDLTSHQPGLPRWVGPALFSVSAVAIALLGLLAFSIMERRWEAVRPQLMVKPLAEFEPDNAVWGENYPRQYETYRMTEDSKSRTKYGGAFPRDYLEEFPNLVILFAGYGFSHEYLQGRGHYHAVEDAANTKRIKSPYNPGTCWTCKSTDVPRVMNKMGVGEFYAANFHDLKAEIKNPIGCQDCHDPKTQNLRITRPALREGLAAMGYDVDKATHQEMRSLVCAQCHVEYYFASEPKNYLTFPWKKGTTVDDMLEYYDEMQFVDWVHPISKTPIIKAQHPDWEMYRNGVHAYRGVSCADCHMPYKSEGGVKFTDHHVTSPLLNISRSCGVCHRWSEDEIRDRVESIQDKVAAARHKTEDILVKAHFDIAAAMEAGLGDEDLKEARTLVRHGQFRWDYVAANNGMGFHAPQESQRILADALNDGQNARVAVAKALGKKGVATPDTTPDVSQRAQAFEVAQAYVEGRSAPLMTSPKPASAESDGL